MKYTYISGKIYILLSIFTWYVTTQATITYHIHKGPEVVALLPKASELALLLFQKYPYLYSPIYDDILSESSSEWSYCRNLPQSIAITAQHNGIIIGMLLATPLKDVLDNNALFDVDTSDRQSLIPYHNYYYIGHVLIDPTYQGQGIGSTLLVLITRYAQEHQICSGLSLLCVERADDYIHPFKPTHYISPTKLWEKHYFEKTNILLDWPWYTLQPDGSTILCNNPMRFWTKKITLQS